METNNKSNVVSVIIPVRVVTDELKEAIPYLLSLQPPAVEIIVFIDEVVDEVWPGVQFITTGAVSPAAKRNLTLRYARGNILAFIDDDAYPRRDWLEKALRHFSTLGVVAVGGPAITPPNDGWQAQLSGAILTSWLGSGSARMRYWPVGSVREIDDWPSVNLLVQRQAFAKVGGFSTNFWPGEDTKLCLDLIEKKGRIVYDPAVLVYHHRATTIVRHLRQVARYGLHRGHFAKIYPKTSLKIFYFLPSLAVLTGGLSVLAWLVWPALRESLQVIYLGILAIVILSGLIETIRVRRLLVALLFPIVLPATHLVYGVSFLLGFLSPQLKRYYRRER